MIPDATDGMTVFVAVAEARSFSAAGDRLGVSASAVSQAVRRLEARIGVALLQRTTRSVRLTAAGEQLLAAVRPALDEVRIAVAAVAELGDAPRGTLRLFVAAAADAVLRGPLLADFLAEHPRVQLDAAVSEAPVDIVAAGYDAGVRIGEVIDGDMIGVPVGGDLRLVVVGAPAYFARHPKPEHPRDLVGHQCIGWRPTPEAPPYRWEFTERGREFTVAVPARALSTDGRFNVMLARRGLGLTMALEHRVRDDLARGDLVAVLDAFCAPFPGYSLYFPQRRHASPALRALVAFLRRTRRT
jgi:DNA-binding transcriptional LysR family regulator